MTTANQYDYLNRLTAIQSTDSNGKVLSSIGYIYNDANQRVRATLADGSYWVYQYDSLGQVTFGKKYWSDGTPVAGQQFEYADDSIGNRLSTKSGGDQNGKNLRPTAYTTSTTNQYLNRYTSRTVPGSVNIIGLVPLSSGLTVSASPDSPSILAVRKGEYFWNELTFNNSATPLWETVNVSGSGQPTVGGVFIPPATEYYNYDPDGNLTGDGRWIYKWDAENRLVTMTPATTNGPQQTISFDYDWKGRRIHKKVVASGTVEQFFVYDGWNLLATFNSAGRQNSFVWGLDLSGSMQGAGGVGGLLWVNDSSGTTHFAGYDGNGNVTLLMKATDSSSAGQTRYEYGPFGEVIRATGPMATNNPFRFSTKYTDDESDLLYYGYRYYNPSTGRWLSRDPIEEWGGLNIYAFAMNDGIDFVDALGLDHECGRIKNKKTGEITIIYCPDPPTPPSPPPTYPPRNPPPATPPPQTHPPVNPPTPPTTPPSPPATWESCWGRLPSDKLAKCPFVGPSKLISALAMRTGCYSCCNDNYNDGRWNACVADCEAKYAAMLGIGRK